MLVKLSCSRSGDRCVQQIGDIVEVSEDEGLRMIDKGQARTVGLEVASTKPKRNAAKPRGTPRRKARAAGPPSPAVASVPPDKEVEP